jgi:hypothetical protein
MKGSTMGKQEQITELLMSTGRDGMDRLVDYLVESGFFESPGSTRFHGCYKGGLADHSYNVYEMLSEKAKAYKLECPADSLIIAPLLHDVCKIGAYLGDSKPYSWNRQQPKGHARLSIKRIKDYIELTELEEMMVKFHMGIYGLTEFEPNKGEYTLRGGGMANAWFHNPIVKAMYFCDEFSSMKEKAEES